MVAVADGDLEAFEGLVRRHQRTAWGVAWRLLRDPAEAEDAAQDAFLKILDAAPRYRPTASFRTYLYRVITHVCLDRLKKKRPVYLARLPIVASPEPGPADRAEAREDAAAVRRALGALPPRQRAALVLRYYECLSYQEIAQAMDTSVKAVERLLARGRGMLRDLLADRKEGAGK